MPCHWASADPDLSLSTTERFSQKHTTYTASVEQVQTNKDCSTSSHVYLVHVMDQESPPSTCKTLLSDSSPVLTSTFSKMHFLAVALVYAAADSSKDSETLFTAEMKHVREKLASYSKCLVPSLFINSGACVKSAPSYRILYWDTKAILSAERWTRQCCKCEGHVEALYHLHQSCKGRCWSFAVKNHLSVPTLTNVWAAAAALKCWISFHCHWTKWTVTLKAQNSMYSIISANQRPPKI